jgi:hypothetical protein
VRIDLRVDEFLHGAADFFVFLREFHARASFVVSGIAG